MPSTANDFLHGVIVELERGLPKPPQLAPLSSAADLGSLIQRARKRMKMSQQQFADASGVGRRFLSELENGKPSLEFDKVLACALAAGIDIFAKPRIPF